MKLQNQVSTSDQSFELKDLGVKQELGNYAWQKFPKGYGFHFQKPIAIPADKIKDIASAFTVAELGIMLGEGHPSWQFEHPETKAMLFIVTRIGPNDPLARYKYKNSDLIPMNTYEAFDRYQPTEAGARAALLIASIKCEVPGFTIAEINERLQNA